jgi:predicted MFS family arabinose efflux permease
VDAGIACLRSERVAPAGGSSTAAALARAAALALGPVVALGLARFAYSLLLPAMRADLGWSYAQAGALNTANTVGYLAGAIPAAWIAARLGSRRTFVGALAVCAAAVLACAATGDFAVLAVLRLIAGASGAVVFITGAGLAARTASRARAERAPLVLGVYVAGAGAGIVATGAMVPAILTATG